MTHLRIYYKLPVMFKTKLQKITAAVIAALILLIMIYLVTSQTVTIYMLYSIIMILPLLILADICFLILPLTVPILLGLSVYTLITKNYEKFNNLYLALLIMVYTGLFNWQIDNILNLKTYVIMTSGLRLYFLSFLWVLFVYGMLYISKRKDTRLYLWFYVPIVVFFLIYQIISAIE